MSSRALAACTESHLALQKQNVGVQKLQNGQQRLQPDVEICQEMTKHIQTLSCQGRFLIARFASTKPPGLT